MSKKLQEELKERLSTRKLEKASGSSSGCISSGLCFTIDEGQKIFVKTNSSLNAGSMFAGEFESLKQIRATETIRVPEPRLLFEDNGRVGESAIVMEYLPIAPLKNDCAAALGQSLANLHDYNNKVIRFNKRAAGWIGRKIPSSKHLQVAINETDADKESEEEDENQFSKHNMRLQDMTISDKSTKPESEYAERFMPRPNTEEVTQFGFHVDTSCGSIPQVNEWTDDWVSFYARYRLDKPIRSLLAEHSDRELTQQWSQLQLKVEKFFTDLKEVNIVPSLLHGDLWSGNVAQLDDGSEGVIYDPSSFYGHNEYEFGIARMFGGIPKAFEDSYFKVIAKKKLFEKRNKLYQLFHHLNHWEHFGTGYRASSLRLMKDLNTLV